MSGGKKHDGGKVMYDLLPGEALHEIARALTYGAKKYEPRNWEHGIAYSRVFAALQRHLWAWWNGEDEDPESGLSHLAHAGCCLMFLLTYEKRIGYWSRRHDEDAVAEIAPLDDRPERAVPLE